MRDRSVIVCDDHPILRNGVVYCLNEIEGITVIAQASDVPSAKAKMEIYTPDILVTDLSMPGESGFELLQWARKTMPKTVVIILSMHTELAFIRRAKELGAVGFLAKEDAETELVEAVAHTGAGFYTSQSIGRSIQNELPELDLSELEDEALKYVSAAEMRVLQLLAISMTNKAIANDLNISPRTVEAHRQRIAKKLDLKGPNKLMEFAIKNRNSIRKNL